MNQLINSSPSLLMVENLSKQYVNNSNSVYILNSLNFCIKQKDFLCILGPSGCGKTTLLRCIAGFEDFEGQIKLNNVPVTTPNIDRIMVFQDFNQLFPWKTVFQNVEYPLLKTNVNRKVKGALQIANTYIEKVGLLPYKNFYPHQLSGGMKQRVAIAKALALKPKIILMDEPFASLDAMTRKKLQNELLEISSNEDTTFVFITHNIQEAIVLGSRIMVLSNQGKIKIDFENRLPKPITPASPSFSDLWAMLNDSLK